MTSSASQSFIRSGGMIVLACVLLGLAASNLFIGSKPTADANDRLANQINQSAALDFSERIKTLSDLRAQQEALLLKNPIEPYGWMRLAYLRKVTQGNRKLAFDALRFADEMAHPDNVGGIERVLMWRDFADVQTEAERNHEKELWRTAYRENWYFLGEVVNRNKLGDVFKSAIMEDPELAERWNKKHNPTPSPAAAP